MGTIWCELVMTFDIEKTVQYWMEGSAYDLETGKSLLESKRYPYALFFGHLALEKILKAFAVKARAEHAPFTPLEIMPRSVSSPAIAGLEFLTGFTHSLTFLASKTGIDIPESILDKLMEFHLEARYPDANKAFYKKCTRLTPLKS